MNRLSSLFPSSAYVGASFLLIVITSNCHSQTATKDTDSQLRQMSLAAEFSEQDLQGPVCVSVSSDGRFVYTASCHASSWLVLEHDKANDKLALVQKATDKELFAATASIRLSNDERFAVTSSIGSAAVSLFERDSETGKLKRLSTKQATKNEEVSGLGYAVEAGFSFDDQFVNVLDDVGGVTVFRIKDQESRPHLEFVEAFRHDDLKGARGLAHHGDASFLFVACKRSHSLVALQQDRTTGRLKIVDTQRDESGGVTGLHSAFGVTTSPTGDFVYVVSGQHGRGKDNAISMFQFDPFAKKFTLKQEVFPHLTSLNGKRVRFNGGNEVCVHSDTLYACATGSGSIGIFARDKITGKIDLEQIHVDGKTYGWVSGLAISPDGQYLYAACEKNNTICVFAKDRKRSN